MLLFEISSGGYKIYCDLDGVLADFGRKVSELLGKSHDESRYEQDKKYKKEMWRALAQHQKTGGEFWYELELMPDAMELWNYIKKYSPEILTATGYSEHGAADQKYRWVEENFGPHVKVNVTQAAGDKQAYAAPHHILIDDKEKSIIPWENAGGIGILHINAANTIEELQELGL